MFTTFFFLSLFLFSKGIFFPFAYIDEYCEIIFLNAWTPLYISVCVIQSSFFLKRPKLTENLFDLFHFTAWILNKSVLNAVKV